MTRSVAFDYGAQGIRANVLCPGYVNTRMVSDYTSRRPTPAAALWLASDASSFVTGAVIPVDGGYTAR